MRLQPFVEPFALRAPDRRGRLLRLFGVERQHLDWRICAEAGRVWRREAAPVLSPGQGLYAAGDVAAGRGVALYPGAHLPGGRAGRDLDTHDGAPAGALDASAAESSDPSRAAHLARAPLAGAEPNVAAAAFRWRDVFLGDDEAPLNPTKRLALDGDGNAVFDAAGAVLVALRPLRRGEELLLAAGAPPDARGSPIIDGDRLRLAP